MTDGWTQHNRRTFLKATATVAAGAGLVSGFSVPAATASVPRFTRTLPEFGQPQHLFVADIRSLNGDEQALFTTLQGIVNRQDPRIYFLLQNDTSDAAWLKTMGIPSTQYDDPWQIMRLFSREVRGMVVYDADVPDTVNLATMIASLSGGVIVSADLATKLSAAPYRLRTLDDLRGRFTDKLSIYKWALAHLRPKLSDQLVTAIGGTSSVDVPGVQWTTLAKETVQLRDGSNKGTYTMDASSLLGGDGVFIKFADAFTDDGWGPSVQQVTVIADGQTIADFQPTTDGEKPYVYDLDNSSVASGGWRFADGGSSFIYRFDPPEGTTSLQVKALMWNQYFVSGTNKEPTMQVATPVFRDYIVATQAFVFWLDPIIAEEETLFEQVLATYDTNTPYLGWFVGGHESQGVTICSRHGMPVLAADFYTNGTVTSGAQAPISSRQPSLPAPKLANKVYVTLTMSEGDNVQYCEHRLRELWDDPRRGEVPINWSINPMLIDLGPALLHYYQQSQTKNDLFVAGPSGAGYTYPGQWPGTTIDQYTDRSGRYMRRTGIDIIYTLNRENDQNLPLPEATARSYVQHIDMPGMLYNWISESRTTVTAGLPITTQVGISSVGDGNNALAAATKDWDGKSPLFVALGVLAWNMTAAQVSDFVAQLPDQYEVVRADAFYALMHQVLG